jgi:hypothetical protein
MQRKRCFLPAAGRILTLFCYLLSAIHIFASNLTFVPHVKISSKPRRSKRHVFQPRFLKAFFYIIHQKPPFSTPQRSTPQLSTPHQPYQHLSTLISSRPSVPIAKPTSKL